MVNFLWHQLITYGALCKMTFISTFFLVFKCDFIKRADFTRITASKTASDDITN